MIPAPGRSEAMPFRPRLRGFFSSPWLALVNALLCAAAVAANAHHQVFCRPVPWAIVVLVPAFAPLVVYPLFRERLQRWNAFLFLLFGIAACMCVYMIVFLREMNLFAVFTLPAVIYELLSPVPTRMPLAGPLAYVPHFFLLQIIMRVFRMPGSAPFRRYFGMGVGLCAAYAATMAVWFNLHYATVRAALAGGDTSAIPRNYMTERMLGMHFKYHLSFCPYDGWRPPLHDPSIVVAVWLTAPFRADLDNRGFASGPSQRTRAIGRIAAYKAVFPDRPVRMTCSCAKGYRKMYLNDPMLR